MIVLDRQAQLCASVIVGLRAGESIVDAYAGICFMVIRRLGDGIA